MRGWINGDGRNRVLSYLRRREDKSQRSVPSLHLPPNLRWTIDTRTRLRLVVLIMMLASVGLTYRFLEIQGSWPGVRHLFDAEEDGGVSDNVQWLCGRGNEGKWLARFYILSCVFARIIHDGRAATSTSSIAGKRVDEMATIVITHSSRASLHRNPRLDNTLWRTLSRESSSGAGGDARYVI